MSCAATGHPARPLRSPADAARKSFRTSPHRQAILISGIKADGDRGDRVSSASSVSVRELLHADQLPGEGLSQVFPLSCAPGPQPKNFRLQAVGALRQLPACMVFQSRAWCSIAVHPGHLLKRLAVGHLRPVRRHVGTQEFRHVLGGGDGHVRTPVMSIHDMSPFPTGHIAMDGARIAIRIRPERTRILSNLRISPWQTPASGGYSATLRQRIWGLPAQSQCLGAGGSFPKGLMWRKCRRVRPSADGHPHPKSGPSRSGLRSALWQR